MEDSKFLFHDECNVIMRIMPLPLGAARSSEGVRMNVPFMEERQNNSCNLELGSNPPPFPSFPLFASFTSVRRANNLAMGEMDLTSIFLGSMRIHGSVSKVRLQ